MLNIDSDIGRHLTIGQYILDWHQIPTTDIFSHTKSGELRPPYEWISQILFALAYRLLGLDGVVLLTSLAIALSFTFVYVEAVRRSGLPIVAVLITVLAISAAAIHWLPRPHIFTFLLLVIWLGRLERLRMGETIPLWHFPVIMLIWVNLHGGFIFGFLAWAAYLAGWIFERLLKDDSATIEIGKKIVLIGLLSFVVSFVTPSGWGNWQAVLGNSSPYILSRTVETMSPDFSQKELWPFLSLLFLCLAIPALGKKYPPASHIFLLMGFTTMSLIMTRNIPLFALVATPILAESARRALDRIQPWMKIESRILEIEMTIRGLIWPVAGTLAIVILLTLHFTQTKESFTQFDSHQFPVSAVDWLTENPQTGRMFNEFNWGGYLLHRLWPHQLVFLDSQTDFYGEELVREYEGIRSTRGDWEKDLAKYHIEWVIISPDSSLSLALQQNANWEIVYQDDVAVILKRIN